MADWRKWCYDVAQLNGLDGYELVPGECLTHVKSVRYVNGYTLFVGRIPGCNVVFDGEYYAHCKTLRDGIAGLWFKHTHERGVEPYKNLTPDSELSFDEAVTAYRVITGACR